MAETTPHLFATAPPPVYAAGGRATASRPPVPAPRAALFSPDVDERLLDVYARAHRPDDPVELRDLYLGRIEAELGGRSHRPELAARWRRSARRREVGAGEVLAMRSTPRFVKELFNWFFRDDLYGDLRPQARIILSGGAVDEEAWGLPWALKECIRYALDRDWYGYSDSRGRDPARQAIAAYENALLDGAPYDHRNVALTMGATFAISALADFILGGAPKQAPALCALPNYPPLVESVSRRAPVRLVPLPTVDGHTSVEPLVAALTPDTPLVLLQTAANPTGLLVPEEELTRLVAAASPTTMIILDECHEWLGPEIRRSPARAAANVVRVSSMSKNWSAPGLKVGWFVASRAFIDEYYEYASTTFGGPPSFFYTAVEVLARMERWLVTGIDAPGAAECAEFETAYGLDLPRLRTAYASYVHQRRARRAALEELRDAAVSGFELPGVTVIPARYSINLALDLGGYDDSYRCFRDVLRQTGVSMFPGILTHCLSGGIVRVTTARRWEDLTGAMTSLASFVDRSVVDRS